MGSHPGDEREVTTVGPSRVLTSTTFSVIRREGLRSGRVWSETREGVCRGPVGDGFSEIPEVYQIPHLRS